MSERKNLVGRTVVILLVLGVAVLAFGRKGWKLNLGQDLRGGTTLRFALDIEAARREHPDDLGRQTDAEIVEQTLKVVATRIDKYGLAELYVTPVGEDKFEISIPREVDADSIKSLVGQLGDLKFRIEVDPVPRREDQAASLWTGTPDEFTKYKEEEIAVWKKARDQAQPYKPTRKDMRIVRKARAAGETLDDFAVVLEPQGSDDRFGGEIITNVAPGTDRQGMPAVNYSVKTDYQGVFGTWTGKYIKQPMAIILNDEYDQAPVIQSKLTDNVEITLGASDMATGRKRQKELVTILQTGSLKVKPRLESKTAVGPTLAGQAVRTGLLSTAIAFFLVLVYMTVYYFRAGLVANLALLMNLVLIVGAMAGLDATLTLPGIAGVVLTLGMAVDANILVFERIREEQARGRSVARAVGEGFDRAFTTIVDSNATTFVTAIFLYAFGTGSIQGFAVTLTLGLLASMFTAIYVTRTVMDAWIGRGRVQRIAMLGQGTPPSVRWMRMRRYFIPTSVLAMAASVLFFAVSEEETVYDIDFTGGMKLQARFAVPTTVDEVKKAFDAGPKKVRVPKDLSRRDEGPPDMEVVAGPYQPDVVSVESDEGSQVEIRLPLSRSHVEGATLREGEQLEALRAYVEHPEVLGGRLAPAWMRSEPKPYVPATGDDPALEKFKDRLKATIALDDPGNVLTEDRLEDLLANVMPYYTLEPTGGRRKAESPSKVKREVKVKEVAGAAGARAKTYDLWWKSETASQSPITVEAVPEEMKAGLREFLGGASFRDALKTRLATKAEKDAADKVFPADRFPVNDLVGAGVAKRLRNDAMLALLLSFAGIIAYVAFRFRSYAMGFAAVFCLVHDVLVALAFVCLANHIGYVDAKINLGLVAAFLTIVGFSVNDTVVTFDRIRELRGKAPSITSRMIEDAVNQTFSRTLRTAVTVFVTVAVLFFMNLGQRSLLEGLSYTLLIGVIAGTYSTIGMASPLLLFLPWFWAKARKFRPRTGVLTWPLAKGRTWVLPALVVLGVVGTIALTSSATEDRWMLAAFFGLVAVPFTATIGLWLAWVSAFAIGAFVWGSAEMIPWSFQPDPEGALADVRRRGLLPEEAPPPEDRYAGKEKGSPFESEEEAPASDEEESEGR